MLIIIKSGTLTPFDLLLVRMMSFVRTYLLKDAKIESNQPILQRINDKLRSISAASLKYVKELVYKRSGNLQIHQLNKFQPGDFVLFYAGVKVVPKMGTRLKGPSVVVKQVYSDVHVRILVSDALFDFLLCDLRGLVIIQNNILYQ